MSDTQPHVAKRATEPLPSMTASSGQAASRAEWNRFRPIIKRLYIDEEKTLNEVMAVMEREYGHRAT